MHYVPCLLIYHLLYGTNLKIWDSRAPTRTFTIKNLLRHYAKQAKQFASSRFQQGRRPAASAEIKQKAHRAGLRPAASLTLDLAQMAFGHLRIKTLCCMGFSAPTTRSAPPPEALLAPNMAFQRTCPYLTCSIY